jgi:hypothetical protein
LSMVKGVGLDGRRYRRDTAGQNDYREGPAGA